MKLLLVEDDAKLAATLRRGLEAEGYAVEVATNGDDGLWRATEGAFDLIVLDIMLPGRNGYRVCAELRAAGVWTPILMLTAKDGELDEAEALDTGADDFLSKPFSFVVLVARLRAVARRGATPRPPVLSAGDLVFDPLTRRCHRGEVPIALTPRELALLEALLRTPNAVVAKRDLLRDVWGDDFDGDANVVEVYVRYLRRKIDEPFGRRTLRTVRGHGYQLVHDGKAP